MKRTVGLLVVLALAVIVPPASAQEHDQSIFNLRSRDIGQPSEELLALCGAKAAEVPIAGTVMQILPLDAEFWTLTTRAKDGLVMNEFVRRVGKADGCGYIVFTGLTPEGAPILRMALYGDSEVSGLTFEGWGECDLPIAGLPTAFSQTGVCHMVLERDEEQGIAGGIATSNSVFGEATGSFWTIRIIWE